MADARPPQRGFVVKMDIGADTREELVREIREYADEIEAEALSASTFGGSTSGGHVELIVTGTTHDEYIAQLKAYLAATSRDVNTGSGVFNKEDQ